VRDHLLARSSSASELARRVLDGDRRAVSKAISIVENKQDGYADIVREVYPSTGRAVVIGVTGPPGTGKSTLVDGLVNVFRSKGSKVAVLAVDPTSPVTGGAILGDRVRMLGHTLDEKVYIRSMASRGDEGGLSRAAMDSVRILDASGNDVIIVETVGIGQNEVEIVKVADVVLVVLMPELGDEIQAAKAGLMEIGDVYAVNKSDLPGADKVLYNVQTVISDKAGQKALKVSAKTGEGIETLATILRQRADELRNTQAYKERKKNQLKEEVKASAIYKIMESLRATIASDPEFQEILEDVLEKRKDPESASKLISEKYISG